MAKQKRATATVKMTYSEDADLIAWWNSIPRGSRNAVMKDMMRDYIAREDGGYRPILPRNVPQPFDPARFTQVCDDTAWIRAALMDLPGYVERVIQHVAAVAPGNGAPAGNGTAHRNEVSDDAAERREQRMKKAKWSGQRMVLQLSEAQAAGQDASPPAGCNVEALHPSQTPCGYRVMTKMSTWGLKRAKCRSLLMRRRGWCSPHSEPHKCDGAEHPPHRSAWFATPTERTSCRCRLKAAPRSGMVKRPAVHVLRHMIWKRNQGEVKP